MTAHLSARSANHLRTPVKSYPLLRDCFSPARIPGVSSNVTLFNTEERVVEHSNLNVHITIFGNDDIPQSSAQKPTC